MKLVLRAVLPIAFIALGLGATGCDKAKKLAEEAAGVSEVDKGEQAKVLAAVGWDETKNPVLAQNFKIHTAFALTDKFSGDLSTKTEVPVPFDLPSQGNATAEKQRSFALVKTLQFQTDPATTYTRFQLVSIARFDAENKKLVIDEIGRAHV